MFVLKISCIQMSRSSNKKVIEYLKLSTTYNKSKLIECLGYMGIGNCIV